MMRDILVKLGFHNIEEVDTAEAAVQLLNRVVEGKKHIQFIISDWNMPGMSGLELLDFRNKRAELSKIPFLMVTVESDREYVLRAVAMGVSDYIVKPFSENIVKNKLTAIYGRTKDRN